MSNQLTPQGLTDLVAKGFRVIQTEVPSPEDLVTLGPIPRGTLDALFDFLSHIETGEVEFKLRRWTDFSEAEVRESGKWLDILYDILYSAGMRPRKIKKHLLRGIIRPNIGRYVRVSK